ncbi:MAG: type II toxin-antitoxin system HicA family toxin [Roseibium sp.]|uniref:type II toxin-antitoxin system HicA family toxin n=1 Tax=Roseibium sp. TaxID=1936156 RepID=UPI001B1B6BC6|nr:type II toxin-antitoxin system HicA family toxin [Roseibium sp.]MBO6893407.1 type II toxin-antitoxin system HicA family toxin [Roseibium sp.]MBO6930717.1 type II toxin-antitoxin system HicA family toxin [Roseibium sp.]
MSRAQQLAAAFKACTGPFPYRDVVRLLGYLGFEETATGGGSRRRFVRSEGEHKQIIRLHEPHPGKEIHYYMVKQIQEQLEDQGLL